MDKPTLCTMALRLMGEDDFAYGSPGWEACELYFSQALYELLASHDWSFARRRKVLAKDESGQYIIPDDCLRIVEVEGLQNWRKYGTRLAPEKGAVAHGAVAMIYTSSSMANRGEIPDNVPEFVRAFILRLAAYISPSISNDSRKRQEFEQEALMVLDHARTCDTQQDNSNDQHPLARLLDNSLLD